MQNIQSIKLCTGEEIIAELISDSETTVSVMRPMTVAMGPQGPVLMPTMITADIKTAMVVQRNNVVMQAPTDAAVQATYTQAVTGLAIPGSRVLMG